MANKPGGHGLISCDKGNRNRRNRRVYLAPGAGGVRVKKSQQQIAPLHTTDMSVEGGETEVASRAGQKSFPYSMRPGFLCIEVFVYMNPSGD